MIYKLYINSGAKGNPGPATVSGSLYDSNDKCVFSYTRSFGSMTSNEAEYRAIYLGLGFLIQENLNGVTCYSNNKVVVNQINGTYKIKEDKFKKWYTEIRSALDFLTLVEIKYLHRDKMKNIIINN